MLPVGYLLRVIDVTDSTKKRDYAGRIIFITKVASSWSASAETENISKKNKPEL